MFNIGQWIAIEETDPRGRALYERHYSTHRYRDHRRITRFVGPGEPMVLLTPESDALFVWRKFIDASGQRGINCAIFRNEGPRLSSALIFEADDLAWQKWPGERLYTYVNAGKIRSTNPGYCFIKAGWQRCGFTKGGLIVLECYPANFRSDSTAPSSSVPSRSSKVSETPYCPTLALI